MDSDLKSRSRRRFVRNSALALASGVVAASAGFPTLALADDGYGENRAVHSLAEKIRQIAQGSGIANVRALTANLITDPNLQTLATDTLQSAGNSLTNFQTALLESVQAFAQAPTALANHINGKRLGDGDRAQLEMVRRDLMQNAAIRRMLAAGNHLRRRTFVGTLTNYVDQVAANAQQHLPSVPPASGNPTFDEVNGRLGQLSSSSGYSAAAAALAPLLKEPAFVPYLREQRASVIVSFIPPEKKITLLLPDDTDPPISDLISSILKLIAAIAGVALVFITLDVGLSAVFILSLIAALAVLIAELIDFYNTLDCDADADPGYDAGECP